MSDCSAHGLKNPCNMCDENVCPAVSYQTVSVSMPVEIIPFANADSAKVSCYGEPIVTPGYKACTGKKYGICSFTVSQTLCVEVPVYFGATASVGDPFVDCGCNCNGGGDCECNHGCSCGCECDCNKCENDCNSCESDIVAREDDCNAFESGGKKSDTPEQS